MMRAQHSSSLPYKSVAVALLFSICLGPIGLLYASYWSGILLLPLTLFFILNKFYFLAFLIWVIGCMVSVRAIDRYNHDLLKNYGQL